MKCIVLSCVLLKRSDKFNMIVRLNLVQRLTMLPHPLHDLFKFGAI